MERRLQQVSLGRGHGNDEYGACPHQRSMVATARAASPSHPGRLLPPAMRQASSTAESGALAPMVRPSALSTIMVSSATPDERSQVGAVFGGAERSLRPHIAGGSVSSTDGRAYSAGASGACDTDLRADVFISALNCHL
eukprot:scaffold66575_cov31-Tisochrysis_lutea.AAC.2